MNKSGSCSRTMDNVFISTGQMDTPVDVMSRHLIFWKQINTRQLVVFQRVEELTLSFQSLEQAKEPEVYIGNRATKRLVIVTQICVSGQKKLKQRRPQSQKFQMDAVKTKCPSSFFIRSSA
jgi:hypothetical protein